MACYWTRWQTTRFITSKVFQPFFSQDKLLSFFPNGCTEEAWSLGDGRKGTSAPHLSRCSAAYPPPCERGQQPHCPRRVPSGHWDPAAIPAACWDVTLQRTARLCCKELRQSGWAINPLLVSDGAGRAPGSPPGSGLTSSNGWVVFCASVLPKARIMCEVTARGTPTLPGGTTQVFLQLHPQLLAQWRLLGTFVPLSTELPSVFKPLHFPPLHPISM